ncbi:MAG TPA: response regulator transcription factor [Candidatus Limnocylindria bacterium]|nr:response regulator transcription factor [Candidatus Limnocylindria bacterium]
MRPVTTDSRARILVVDDDEGVTSVVKRALERDGYDVATASSADEALRLVPDYRPDALVLDILMPGTDGVTLAKRLRAERPDTGILMVTAKDAAADQVTGLDAGADDYLVKPFSLQVLEARLRAVLRRRQPSPEVIVVGDLELDMASRRARRGNREIDLTATEYRLLVQLMREAGHAIPKHELTQRVWGYDFEGNDNVLEVYIGYLRNKLEAQGEPRMIHTLRGVGYEIRPVAA